MSKWKESLKHLKSSSLEKDEVDRNMKIEAALNSQGKKQVIPAEAHEALHSWYQAKGKSLLSPEQSQKMKSIKEPNERRANFKLVKASNLNDIQKSLEYLKEAVQSDLFKAKMARSEWKPSKEYSGSDMEYMKPHLDAGHSMQEAAHLSGIERTPANHGFKAPEMSPVMREKAKAAALNWISTNRQNDATKASPEANPEKFLSGKAHETHANMNEVASNYADSLKDHKSKIKHLNPEDQIKSTQDFKRDWHGSTTTKMAHMDAAKTHSDLTNEADDARRKELYEQRKNILLGGQGLGTVTPTHTESVADQEEPLSQEDLEDIHHG